MVRREKADRGTYWGISKPPYTEWTWTNLNVFVGGPDFIILEDGVKYVKCFVFVGNWKNKC